MHSIVLWTAMDGWLGLQGRESFAAVTSAANGSTSRTYYVMERRDDQSSLSIR